LSTLNYYPGIRLQERKKSTKKYQGRDSNLAPPQCGPVHHQHFHYQTGQSSRAVRRLVTTPNVRQVTFTMDFCKRNCRTPQRTFLYKHDYRCTTSIPPPLAHLTMNITQFSDRRIGSGCPQSWPPRSPDLSLPLNFHAWVYIKTWCMNAWWT